MWFTRSSPTATVLLIYPWADLQDNPVLGLLLDTLTARGIIVELLTSSPSPTPPEPGVEWHALPAAFFNVINDNTGIRARLASWLRWLRRWRYRVRLAARSRRKVVIGVNPAGVILAAEFARSNPVPLVYLSFEILFRAELQTTGELGLKAAELAACRRVGVAMVQDPERAAALSAETGLPQPIMELIPVAPPPSAAPPDSSDWLRQRLGIAAERRIVLYIGSLATWTSRDFLGDLVATWPEEFVLVIHTRFAPEPRMQWLLNRLVESGRVHFSTTHLPPEQLPWLVASADYGLAPYKPNPDTIWSLRNIHHVGLAAGKVAYYAMCGLPLLLTDLPAYRKLLSQYDCGRAYSTLATTGTLLAEMESNHAHHRAESLRLYRELLDPTPGMERLVTRITQLGK